MIGRRGRRQNTFKQVAVGGAIAGLAGYVAGVLTAPKSGKATRKELKEAANKNITAAEKELKKVYSELSQLADDLKKRGGKSGTRASKELKILSQKAGDAREKAREMLSAVHEGAADDKDLKKAIKDAQAAIDHLKDYLKK